MALAVAMLSACATSDVMVPADGPAANPVIETRREVIRTCPPALSQPVQAAPEPEADAVVTYNSAGGRWMARLIAGGQAGWDVVTDAKAECEAADG